MLKIWAKILVNIYVNTDKYSQKPLDHAKQSATDALETASKRAIKKTAETTGDLSSNKIAGIKNFTTEYLRNSYKWGW